MNIQTIGQMRFLTTVSETPDGWEWTISSLPVDYPGCDGLCTYGCGSDPWTLLDYGHADTEEEATAEANAGL